MSFLGIQYKKALIQGAAIYAYASYSNLADQTYGSIRFGTDYPAPIVLAGAAVGAGIVGDYTQDQILPARRGGKFMRSDTAILSAMVHAATYIGLLSVYNPKAMSDFGTFNLIAQAVGSDMAAEYVSMMI